MKRLLAGLITLLGLASPALAQRVTNPTPNAGVYGAYNTSPPTCVAGSGCWLQTDVNGVLKVVGTGGAGGSVTQGTIPWVVSGQGTAGTAATGVVTVQGIAAMTPLLATATLAAETTKVIGTVNQGTSPWVVSGTVTATPTGTYTVATAAADPCQSIVAAYTPISMTSATTLRIVAPTSAKRTYVCYLFMLSAIANNVAIVEGTGGTCGSSTAGIVGGTTAANGINLAANSGAVFQAGGNVAIATAGTNVDLCLITSAAGPLAGHIKWVQAP